MRRNLDSKLFLLVACAGLMGCDPVKKMENAQEEQQKVAVEAAEKRAELNREQGQKAAELIKEHREERADLTQKSTEQAAEEQREAVKLGTEQMQERAKVEGNIAEDMAEANKKLSKAEAELDKKRFDLQTRSRVRLEKISARTSAIETRAKTAEAKEQGAINETISSVREGTVTATRDIDALARVAAENLKRAEKTVDDQLAALEKKLDKAEDKL